MMDMFLKFGPWILNLAIALFVFVMKSTFVSKSDYQDNKEAVTTITNGLDSRVGACEVAVANQPSAQDFHDISLSNARLEEQMKAMVQMQKASNKQIHMIDEYLRKGDKL